MAYRFSPLSHTGLCTSIFCIIPLLSPIPIPGFRQAIILLLRTVSSKHLASYNINGPWLPNVGIP